MAMCIIAFVGVAPCQCFKPGGNQTTSPRPDFLDRPALGLDPAESRRDDQRLAKRMCVPSGARARLERDMSAGYARRIARLKQRVDADSAGEVLRRSSGGRPRAVSYDLHWSVPC